MALQDFIEEVQVLGRDLVDRVRSLIHEGNVQRIVIKDVHGNTFVEIPVSVAAIGVVLAPVLAAVGAISALVAKFTIVVERARVAIPHPLLALRSRNSPKLQCYFGTEPSQARTKSLSSFTARSNVFGQSVLA
jgi:hypothetical protein